MTGHFRLGDEVTRGEQRGVIVWSLPRASDGKQWPMVRITTQPGEGQRVWPDGWHRQLDHGFGDGRRAECICCERWFKQSRSGQEGRCYQCVRKGAQAANDRPDNDQHAETVAGSHDMLNRPWRWNDMKEQK